MSPERTLRSRSALKESHPRLTYRLTLALALCLILLLQSLPHTGSRAVARRDPRGDGEALFNAKADPLLQMIRQAALADRTVSRPGAMTTRATEGLSELKALSNLAGVEGQTGGATRVSLTATLKSGGDAELKAAGFPLGARVGQLATIETGVERLAELAALTSVNKLTVAARSYPNNDLSRRAIGVDDASGQRAVSHTGRGVVVAVIDDGIDFRHPDFTVPGTNGQQTRIKALLDMTVYDPQAPPLAPDPNWDYVLPGATAPIGHLYNEADINSALHGQATVRQRNKTGHGTNVAGTAAG